MFDTNVIKEFYPEAENLMIEPMKIWQLPDNKKNMLSEICRSGDYLAQEKIDGAFYQFVKTPNHSYLFGRTVSVKNGLLTEKGANVPHLIEAFETLPVNTILIGEIYYPSMTSKDTVTIMGCLPEKAIERQKDNPIHFYVHDIIMYDGINLINVSTEYRYKILEKIWTKHRLNNNPYLRLATLIEGDIEDKIAEILAAGGEGVVLKKKDAPYYPGKRPAWSTIKVKQMDTVDLICIGFCDATKEYTGKELETWPYWEERGETLADGSYKWYLTEGLYYNDYTHNPHIYRPVTKPYFMGWKTAMRVGAYNDKGKLYEIGTVSSGLTDKDRELMAKEPEKYLNKVFNFTCMSIDKKEHTLRHPVFVGPRPDKNPFDCIMSEIFS